MKLELQFVAEHTALSHMIQVLTHSEYSHVDLIWPWPFNVGGTHTSLSSAFCIGARQDGVQFRPINYAKFSRRAVYSIEVTDEQAKIICQFMKDQVGKPYDYTGLFGFLANRDWHAPDSWFCSEAIEAAFEKASLPLLAIALWSISPRDLMTSIRLTFEYVEDKDGKFGPSALEKILPHYLQGDIYK